MQEKIIESKYSLENPSFQCKVCSNEVPPGEHYFSAVLFEEEAFLRKEFCSPCWKKEDQESEALFAFWKTQRPLPPETTQRRRRFDMDVIWNFFKRLESGGTSGGAAGLGSHEERTKLNFLIALLLVRGKKLVLEGSAARDGEEWLKLSEKGNPEAQFHVKNPNLASEDLEKIKQGLGELLQMEI